MEKVVLKNTDIEVSRLCFGGCPMGGYGWGEVSKKELIDAVQQAVEQGINFFDNADTYGLGASEETLSEALGSLRKKVVIGTKFGVRVEDGKTFYDNSPKWIETALHNSLKRLNTDYIDLYQIHYRDEVTPICDVVETLERFKEKGYIRAYGLSNVYSKDIEELEKYSGKFATVQNEFSLACRKNETDIQKMSKDIKVTAMTWGSLGQGVLTGKYDENTKFEANDRRSREIYVNFHGEKFKKNLEIVKVMKDISLEINKPLSAIALRWILDYLKNSVVLVGIKRPQQLFDNLEGIDWNLSDEHIRRLDEISLK